MIVYIFHRIREQALGQTRLLMKRTSARALKNFKKLNKEHEGCAKEFSLKNNMKLKIP